MGGGTLEENYDEEYVTNIMTEQAELNLKYRSLFADQSKRTQSNTKLQNNKTETQNEQTMSQKQTDQKNLYHRGGTREIMEIIRRRNNSPETRRLVEQRNALARPGTLRRRYAHQSQTNFFAPSRPNKRSREEIAKIDAKPMRRTNRLGGEYQPI